jgi:hypothetical protein
VGAVDDIVEGRPVDKLHHQTADVLRHGGVVHGGDVGVVQTSGGLGLPLEARQGGTAPVGQSQKIRGNSLDRGGTLQIHVRPLPDVPHRSFAQNAVQPVAVTQYLARGELLHVHFPR